MTTKLLTTNWLTTSTYCSCPSADIVGDFVASQHTDEELRQSHRRLVDLLRAARPVDAVSKSPEWNNAGNTLISRYVRDYCSKHIQHGWNSDWENDQHAINYWLGDTPQDDIVRSAGRFLGYEKLLQLVEKANDDGRKFDVAKLAANAGRCALTDGHDIPAKLEIERRAMDALGELAAGEASEHRADEERLELEVLVQLLSKFDPVDYRFLPRTC
eukprot:COSAG02_NODE_233_length_27847_cov_20.383055_19_plen_215_part_00